MKKSLFGMVLIGIAMLVLFNGCVVGEKGNQPPLVELRTPANEATNQELNVVLEWNGQPGGGAARGSSLSILGYLVYFAVADQAYGVAEATQGNELEKAGLAYGTRYKWKVEAVQSDGQRSCSSERFFTTKQRQHEAPQVELLLPANAATGQATELTLSWEATPGSQLNASARVVSLEGYFVYFGEQGEPYPEPQWVTRKSLQKEQLAYGTSYKWQVVAVQSDGQVATSTQNTFTTVHEAEYAAPSIQLLSPAHGATGQATRVMLSWQAQPGEVLGKEARGIWLLGYRVYLAREGESYAEPRWTENSQIQEPGLAYNTTYKWKVSVLQSDGQTTTSTERTFRTEQEEGAPQIELVSPADFATEQATTLTLTWEATPGADTAGVRAVNITGYELYFAKATESYGSPEAVSSKQLQKSNLEYATLYKWKVVAKQSDGKSAASEEWAFSTEQESYALPQVALQTPSHEATMVSLNPTLTWEATVGTQSNAGARAVNLENYEVYFAKVGEDYASPVITQAKSLGKVNLEPYTAYKWKVTANQSDGQQATTPEATFQTAVTFFMGNTLNSSLGDQNEKPVHGVVFTYDFELGKYEVTFDQYDAYLLATGQPTSTVNDGGWGRGSRPVMNVSWEDAVRYCNWLSDVSGFPRAYDETTWDLLDEDGATTTDITKVKGWRLPTEA
ncbi:MAG TPA: SUMF1/EgtB/PvdO family nonheme iron enzyme, partial [Thermotogota bacterium]|nr:SUMF1/EgtB/PvdO family nonheme iron enzyme [Thermotogota bacterium]